MTVTMDEASRLAENVLIVRVRTGVPARDRYCLGMPLPAARVPRPAATMTTAVSTAFLLQIFFSDLFYMNLAAGEPACQRQP
jgi:hypothetical protein